MPFLPTARSRSRSRPRRAPETAPQPLDDAMIEAVRRELAVRLFKRWGLRLCYEGACPRMWCRRHGRCRAIVEAARSHPEAHWPQIQVAKRPPRVNAKRPDRGGTAAPPAPKSPT